MAEIPPGPTEPLDVQRIHYLARLMKRYDLTSLDLADGPVHIRLRRQGRDLPQVGAVLAPQTATGLPPAAYVLPGAPPSTAEPVAPPAPAAEKASYIESPMVGTYYTSRAPDAPPLVTVGSVVHPGSIVCIIEAMKVFTDIPAGVSGMIVEVLAKNGQAVEYGQPLFRVTPS
jgi:acetyl-CoA carboxylase biotin carboxyl carrier protein